MKKRTVKMEPADPFSYRRLWGDEKYNLQNMCLIQVRMPASLHLPEDRVCEVWHDRVPSAVMDVASALLKTTNGGIPYLYTATEESVLAFGQAIVDAVEGDKTFKVTGIMTVHFTNAGGYPTLRSSIVGLQRPGRTYSGNSGPNIKQPVYIHPSMNRLYGWRA